MKKRMLAIAWLLVMTLGALTACDYEITINKKETEAVTDENGEVVTSINGTDNEDEFKAEHSDLFWRAKASWSDKDWNWHYTDVFPSDDERFQRLGNPFNFLEKEGAVYRQNGQWIAYGNEEFDFNGNIQTRVFVDKSTPEHDVYMLVQYHSSNLDGAVMGDDTYVATWMLKYDVPEDVYKDLLMYADDYRCKFLIQQIDKEYEPEVISKSVIDYDLLNKLSAFSDNDFTTIEDKDIRYIENIDYDNMSLTVNEGTLGNISSYTYCVKESKAWENVLVETPIRPSITKEERDALTAEDIMPSRLVKVGNVLLNFIVENRTSYPSEEQKATATQKYNLTYISNGAEVYRKNAVNAYEEGEISFESVNEHTREYAKTH